MKGSRFRFAAVVVGAFAAVAALTATAMAGPSGTAFYAPGPNPSAQQQIAGLTSSGRRADAALVAKLAATPHAVWITSGTPNEARVLTQKTVNRAAGKNELPVIALYNIPGRDCGNFSAGGATDLASYEAWIDGVAGGLRGHEAMIILEPDSLGLLPQSDCGSSLFTDADRLAELNYAVDVLSAAGGRVYLDGTHSGWLGVGAAASRLVAAGVQRAAGFYLNVSNYQPTPNLVHYGTWISECIAFANNTEEGGWRLGHYDWCASQYYPATSTDTSTWHLSDEWYAGNLGHATPTTHFVIDTSRNGQGAWSGPLDWCNPPGRGAGIQPTADTGNALVDAYLWIKVPGESDGQCTRGDTTDGTDSAWGVVDPAAGQWFPQQALQLAKLASPPLR
jgi:endoglucanase